MLLLIVVHNPELIIYADNYTDYKIIMRASHPPTSHLCLFRHILCTRPNMEQVVSAYAVLCVAMLIIPLV